MIPLKTETIENEYLRLEVCNYGLRIVDVSFKIKGEYRPMILSYKNLEDVLHDEIYLNSIIGPIAGRLKNGNYTLDDKTYSFDINEGQNSLHAGEDGLHKQYFTLSKQNHEIMGSLVYDGIIYTIVFKLEGSTCSIHFEATPNSPRHINLTQHTYFNIDQSETIKDHILQMDSKEYAVLDTESLPKTIDLVSGTLFDFNEPILIDKVLQMDHPQFKTTKHIDHPFHTGNVSLKSRLNDISLDVVSDAPWSIVYFGNHCGSVNFLDKHGNKFTDHNSIAIEPQSLPNTITESIYTKENPFKRVITYIFSNERIIE